MIIGRQYKFDAAHFLPGHAKCGKTHGHTWTVNVEVQGEVDESGMVLDFHMLNEHVNSIVDVLDHKLVNDVLPMPTAENIAQFFHDQLRLKLDKSRHPLIWVKVQEGEGGYAIR